MQTVNTSLLACKPRMNNHFRFHFLPPFNMWFHQFCTAYTFPHAVKPCRAFQRNPCFSKSRRANISCCPSAKANEDVTLPPWFTLLTGVRFSTRSDSVNSKEDEEEKTCLARKPCAGGDDGGGGEAGWWCLLAVDRVVLEAQREDRGRKMATRVRTLDDMAGIEL